MRKAIMCAPRRRSNDLSHYIDKSPGKSNERLPFARAHNELAAVYEAKGDYERALQSRVRGNEIIERHLTQMLAPRLGAEPARDGWDALRNQNTLEVARLTGAENYRQGLVDSISGETDAVVSLNVSRLPRNGQAAQSDTVDEPLESSRRWHARFDGCLLHASTTGRGTCGSNAAGSTVHATGEVAALDGECSR